MLGIYLYALVRSIGHQISKKRAYGTPVHDHHNNTMSAGNVNGNRKSFSIINDETKANLESLKTLGLKLHDESG